MNSDAEEDDDECPDLVPLDQSKKIPVTIITGYLGKFVFWGDR